MSRETFFVLLLLVFSFGLVVLFANKSDLLTNAKESFVLGARMEQLCRKVRQSGPGSELWLGSARIGAHGANMCCEIEIKLICTV